MAAMWDTDTSDDIIRRLVVWAEGQTTLRAMLLTSTRAIPGAAIDALSDYDVVLVAYWDPVTIDPDTGVAQSGNIVQYDCDLKIDFTLWPVALLERISRLPKLPAELDAGYRVLSRQGPPRRQPERPDVHRVYPRTARRGHVQDRRQ